MYLFLLFLKTEFQKALRFKYPLPIVLQLLLGYRIVSKLWKANNLENTDNVRGTNINHALLT